MDSSTRDAEMIMFMLIISLHIVACVPWHHKKEGSLEDHPVCGKKAWEVQRVLALSADATKSRASVSTSTPFDRSFVLVQPVVW